MNSVNRVRPTVQFQCVSLCPFVYVRIVREPGKPINHKVEPKDVVAKDWSVFTAAGIAARQAATESKAIVGGSSGNRTDSAV